MVIDSLGIGYMDDVLIDRKNDLGANTLKHVIESAPNIKIPTLEKLGIFNVLDLQTYDKKKTPNVCWGKAELGHKGADSFFGHVEMLGYKLHDIKNKPFSYYIDKIYTHLIEKGFKVNYSNTNVKYLIIDNSVIVADNMEAGNGDVYSIIGCTNNISYKKIKRISHEIRQIVDVSRVVSVGCSLSVEEMEKHMVEKNNVYVGIDARKCELYKKNYEVGHLAFKVNEKDGIIGELIEKKFKVSLLGKVADLINVNGPIKIPNLSSEKIIDDTLKQMKIQDNGLIAVNFQECDLAGHLEDVNEYTFYLQQYDLYLKTIIENMNSDDVLIVCGDHGNDPTIGHRNHTRERVPILIYGKRIESEYIGEYKSLSIVSEKIKEMILRL